MSLCVRLVLIACVVVSTYGEKPVVDESVILAPPSLGGYLREKFQYFDNDNLVLDLGNGIVNIHDYKTGLHVVQNEKNGTCFVYPTYHRYEDGKAVREFVNSGKRVFTNVDLVRFEPLGPYSIKETAFLPTEAKNYCTRDYKWAKIVEYVVKHSSDDGSDQKEIERALQGRDMSRFIADAGCGGTCVVCW